MLKRNSGLKKTSSLKQSSCLKNNKSWKPSTNLKAGGGLSTKTSLNRGTSRLSARTGLSHGESSLKTHSSLAQNTSLKSKTTLKQGENRLEARTALSQGDSSLANSTPLEQKQTKLKASSYKRTKKASALNDILAMPKGNVQNQEIIDACRRPTCEICGRDCHGEPHHIISRGAGGADIPENLIQLCGTCHTKAHSGELTKDRILWAVACRLKKSPAEIASIIKNSRSRI